jgi:hypothetical protein
VAFLIGAAAAMALETAIWYLLAGSIDLGRSSDAGSTGSILQLVLVGFAIYSYVNRETIEPPKWLGTLLEAGPRRALVVGFLLILLMPTDVASMLTVGVNLEHNSESLIDGLPFFAATLLIAAAALLANLLFGRRAREAMPKVRDWMTSSSWLVNIIVCVIFVFPILAEAGPRRRLP